MQALFLASCLAEANLGAPSMGGYCLPFQDGRCEMRSLEHRVLNNKKDRPEKMQVFTISMFLKDSFSKVARN